MVVNFIDDSKEPTLSISKPSENVVGKGENAGNQHFLLFHNIFCSVRYVETVVCTCFEFEMCRLGEG